MKRSIWKKIGWQDKGCEEEPWKLYKNRDPDKERKLKEESNRLERECPEMEKTEELMQHQNDMLTAILEIQRQQNGQAQASQMVLMQQQGQELRL